MLEFLKECVETSVYERAMDCEINLRAYNSIVPIQTYFELMLKKIYRENNKVSDGDLEYMPLGALLRNDTFIKQLKKIIPSFDYIKVKNISSNIANPGKHSIDFNKTNGSKVVKESFEMVYNFSADYYYYQTGKKAPKWSDDAYDECLNKIDFEAREKIEKLLNEKEADLEKIEAQNVYYSSKIEELKKDIEKYQNDSFKKAELENKYNILMNNQKESEEKIQELNSEMDLIKTQLSQAKTELELYHNQVVQKEASKEQIAPKCDFCNAPMILKKKLNDSFWACSNWKPDGSGCVGSFKNITVDQMVKLQAYQNNSVVVPNVNNFQKQIEFSADLICDKRSTVDVHVLQSLMVSRESFELRKENHLIDYSRFFVMSNLNRNDVDEKQRTIYSLVLRLLNRGVILPADSSLEKEIKDIVTNAETICASSLFDDVKYSSPFNTYDSKREKEFAEYYFPKVLGPSWASYVVPQMSFDVLVEQEEQSDKRVDFFVNYNGKKVILELDGREHRADSQYDNSRDTRLKEHGYTVLRFSNDDIDSKSDSILNILEKVFMKKSDNIQETGSTYIYDIGIKIYHQVQIAVAKGLEQGYLKPNSLVNFKCENLFLNNIQVEKIFRLAIEDLSFLIEKYSVIYGLMEKTNLCVNATNDEGVTICYGDGKKDNSIIIRNFSFDKNYLCRIEPFADGLYPQNTSKTLLQYFLKYIFDYDSFNPGQYKAITRILQRKESIILLPTGAGKSIIYQLASFIAPGVTVVISPLRSLIEDQIINLEENNGITNAIPIYSIEAENRNEIMSKNRIKMKHNSTCLLYISPERLQIPSFNEDITILKRNNNIFAVAIDEAHCVSEWGHEFRPAYLNIGSVTRQMFKKGTYVPHIVGLTGTASEAVLKDVQRDLEIFDDKALIKPKTFDRDELVYSVKNCLSINKISTLASTVSRDIPKNFDVDFNQLSFKDGKNTKSGIIFTPYAASAKPGNYDAYNVANSLSKALPFITIGNYFTKVPDGYDSQAWAGLVRENAKRFKENDINLLVATKAYGMGIDKSNVRFVIHDGIPSSFEQFYQEVGRAGRDRKHSECVLVFSSDNNVQNEKLLDMNLSFDDFAKLKNDYGRLDDDLNSILFFHLQSYVGTQTEKSNIENVIDFLHSRYQEGSSSIEHLSLDYLNVDISVSGNDYKRYQDTKQNVFEKSMVRLRLLGIINRYLFDYSKREYTIFINEFDSETVLSNYLKYVQNFDAGRVRAETLKLDNHKQDKWDSLKHVANLFVDFVYDNIERNRRTCIRNMYDFAMATSKMSKEEQNEYFHNYINDYFKTNDAAMSVYEDEESGIFELLEHESFTELISESVKQRADSALPGIRRLRESKANHPGLLMMQAVNEIKSGKYSNEVILNDVISAISFAKSDYALLDEEIYPVVTGVLNLALTSSVELCEQIFEAVVDKMDINRKELSLLLIDSDLVSDENRDYFMIDYFNEFSKSVIGG